MNQMASSASAGSLAAEMHSSADSLVTEPYWNTGNLVTETHWAPARHYNNGNYREREVVLGELGACYIQLPIETPCRSGVLHAKRGFVISIWRGQGVYCADDTYGLGILEAALTYEELLASIDDTLAFLWDEYAMADDIELNEGAVTLKLSMLKHFFVAEV